MSRRPDIYRRQARNLAWYDQEGEQSNHNPFKKFRARPRRSNSYQMESGLAPVRTAGEVRMSEERRRRRDMTDGLAGPEHADTFPPESSGTDGLHRAESAEKSDPEPSMRSHEPINVSNQEGQDEIPFEGKPRKRKTFLSGYGSRSEDGDAQSSVGEAKDMPDKQKFTAVGQLKATLFNSWMNLLLIAAPVGIALNYVDVDPVAVFVVNFVAIIPLAAMLGYATEEIAMRTGETIGGLLNASFGNAVELIVAIIALVDKEVLIVQTSLIGSMLSNLLLVMGMCFFFGGVNRLEQHFNPVVAQTAASLLALAVASLIIPTAFHAWSGAGTAGIAPLSRGTSIILLFVYGCYLFFQLKSHTEIYNRPSPKVEKRRQKVSEGDASRGLAQIGKMTATMGGQNAQQMKIHEEDDEEQPQLSTWVAVLTLAISTAFVALCAEFMVGSIDALTERGGISKTFVGLILLPIVGNAAEHATAVTVACKDKMDLSIGVAVGSSMQIALLVLPLIIVIGWIMGLEEMTLYFDAFQVILLFVSVLLVNYLIADGKSHWLEGVLLMMMYLIIAVAAWFYPNKSEPAA
ncbi:hydrogen/calcium exchanger domain-containing protein [Aspergillus fischeri NRRL 181]|uniref:Sodium/calcium transporter, putative n=1 Tax=Neosartorya fischeri (strain ATCC 1020 / DSM 3700 / CBS 544.65 / FGSC A1164 / JCM 1740 / NRRL 181 / WB 181) TaxID=331117 RepID=A1DFV4_NEOFI|nr:sodium/calcium transporter, putative [Aspergillus fischeri NRRL 181]EAW18261.1 sodium/calcium transporter, putative [Aspergillus fischeri NRRL 181]